MAKIDWYDEFIDLGYKPAKDEIVTLFYFEPGEGISKREAVGRIASESSTGTWTTLFKLPPRMKKLMATVYRIEGNFVEISYPRELWEDGNAPQLLSGIAGNIFGMKALKNLRLIDASIPEDYLKGIKGPKYGVNGLRALLEVKKRPLTGAVPKPKIGFSAKEHAEIAYETWMGGFDLTKDDENLTSTPFNRFEERVRLMTKLRDKAERETGDVKDALLNITGETNEMIRKAKMLHNYGWRCCMIDVVTTGTASVQTLRDECGDLNLAIHAHRAMHAAFDRNPKHGMTMYFLAKMMRMIGVDEIHVGTAVGKLVGSRDEVRGIADMLRETEVSKGKSMLDQKWGNTKPCMPVSSGGLHPGLVPDVMKLFGNDFTLLVSGGIHGHPKGTRAGAKAAMQAVEATMEGIELEDYAKTHVELAQALEKWHHYKPK